MNNRFKKVWAHQQLTVSTAVVKLPGAPTKAEVSIDPTGSNNTLIFQAGKPGLKGNNLAVQIVNPGIANNLLDVYLSNNTLMVNLATNGSGTVTTTAQQVIDAIRAEHAIFSLIRAFPSGAVSGTMAAVARTALTGGANATGDFLLPFTHAYITLETADIVYTADGAVPATTMGARLRSGSTLDLADPEVNYRSFLEDLRLVRVSADGLLNIEYSSY